MKLLLDMNLSPAWVRFLEENGSEAAGPSVLQVRTQDVLPDSIGLDVLRVLRDHRAALDQGAIVSVDQLTARVRVLPIQRR